MITSKQGFKLISIAILMFSQVLQASVDAPKPTLLLDRTYSLRITGKGSITCTNPLPPNGHNFPIYTTLQLSQIHYDLWLSNVWTNVDNYMSYEGFKPCSTFSKLTDLKDGQELIATVEQKITERYAKNGFGDCMRYTREDATLTVEGVQLFGVNEFFVGPLPKEKCQ